MNWKVKYIDYPAQFKKMQGKVLETIHTVLSKGDLILRQQLADFETNLAKFVGARYAVGVSNCTDALHLSLRATGIGAGDDVITVSHTFVATVEAITHAGARPVLTDIGEDHNMDANLLEDAVTPRAKAIIPVHLNGRLCDMEKVFAVAKRHNLAIIEDAAQAFGASFKGKKGGAFGIAGCFSFYPAKLLGAFGDGGAVVTNSIDVRDRVRSLRDHGRLRNGGVERDGFNCRLDNLQAAILDLKLKRVPAWIGRRRRIASIYHRGLSDIPQVRLPSPPAEDGLFYDVFQNYEIEAERRDGLKRYLAAKGIETMLPWGGKGIHQLKRLGLGDVKLPRTERLFERVLMLPMHADLTDGQTEYVIEVIKRFYKK